ncbi:hypothetical protein LTR66_012460 [Elasticomyces elasticus]|nr:hypothetical protein LTR66_012460 [Elasticomyces elasticus]
MAYALALTPQSSLDAPFGNSGYIRSCSSLGSQNSTGTVHRQRPRKVSASSFVSLTSYAPLWHRSNENTPPRPSSTLNIVDRDSPDTLPQRRVPFHNQRRTSLPAALAPGSLSLRVPFGSTESLDRRSPELPPRHKSYLVLVDEEDSHSFTVPNWRDSFGSVESEHQKEASTNDVSIEVPPSHSAKPADQVEQTDTGEKPLKRWLSTLRRRRQKRKRGLITRLERWDLDDQEMTSSLRMQSPRRRNVHHKSDSFASSVGIITAMKSATATLASVSIAPLSKRATVLSGHLRHRRRASMQLGSEPRTSIDSNAPSLSPWLDEAARQRSRKRREKIEELIRTEENYVGDLKALTNAYFTILTPNMSMSSFTRTSAQQNVTRILELHDDLLSELHRVVPHAEYDQTMSRKEALPAPSRSHIRWHSAEIVPPRVSGLTAVKENRRSLNISRSSEQEPLVLHCTPEVAADVAKVFDKQMKRFVAYEEYGAKYDLMQQDIEFAQRAIPAWHDYDKGIETLAASINPTSSREANCRKALTIKDLLIKPIQRVTRYELLFKDLCRLTPVVDEPQSHATLEGVLARISETCRNINQAKDNPERMRLLEASWLLQDRLSFSDQVLSSKCRRSLQ